MKLKHFFLIVAIGAFLTACSDMNPVDEPTGSYVSVDPVSDRTTVNFDDAVPLAIVGTDSLHEVTVYGGAGGEDSIRIKATGLTSNTVELLEFGNSCSIHPDSLSARGFYQSPYWKCKTTAAFRACHPGVGLQGWDVKYTK